VVEGLGDGKHLAIGMLGCPGVGSGVRGEEVAVVADFGA
jgi:hypothetical protein